MIFLSYSSEDTVEAHLLQFAFETLMEDIGVEVWTYERDQEKHESKVAESLKQRVMQSDAMCFLVSDSTISGGASQWMELAYADAFDVPTFIMLHRIKFEQIKSTSNNIPPLLLSAHCNQAVNWKDVAVKMREELAK